MWQKDVYFLPLWPFMLLLGIHIVNIISPFNRKVYKFEQSA